jgi:hypothetical protein
VTTPARCPTCKGNRYFNTLGNMVLDDPGGAAVHRLRTAATCWNCSGVRRHRLGQRDADGTRSWRFASAMRATLVRAALPLRWTRLSLNGDVSASYNCA